MIGATATADERAIRDLVATWMAASARGDRDTVMSLVADDAVFLVPGQEPFGKAIFGAAFDSMRSGTLDAANAIEEIQVFGPWAFLRGRLKVTFRPGNGGASVRQAGSTLTVLRKSREGRWQIARDANLLMPD